LKNRRTIPVEGLRWLEAGLPTTATAPLGQRLSSGYLPDGYHLALPQNIRIDPPTLDELGPDGTFAGDYLNPPSPFNRRMWAGGEYIFHKGRRISLRDPLYVKIKVMNIELKGLSGSEPKVFLTRRFDWSNDPQLEQVAITEDRTHVFLTPSHQKTNRTQSTSPEPEFSINYKPSTTLLFRFSAVSQNDHKIHYEHSYAREVEGLPGLAVHGPMTALLLTQLAAIHLPKDKRLAHFQYRATHPLIVNDQCSLNGTFEQEGTEMRLWASNEGGIVGMKAQALLENA